MTPAEYRTRDRFLRSSSDESAAPAARRGQHPEEVFRLPRESRASSLRRARGRGSTGRGEDNRALRLRPPWRLEVDLLRPEGVLLAAAERRGTARRPTIIQRSDAVDELEEEERRREEICFFQLRHQLRGEARSLPEARCPRGQGLPQGRASR